MSSGGDQTTGDYEYDLTHDLDLSQGGPRATPPEHKPVQVSVPADDEGEDLGYDLAHDVPR